MVDTPICGPITIFEQWESYLKIICGTEEGRTGGMFFTREGILVDISPVQKARLKHYPFAKQCIDAAALGDRIVFWEALEFGKPYDCSRDSNASGGFAFPRHHLFSPKTKTVKTVEHKPPCHRFGVVDGKLSCTREPGRP